MKKKTKKYKIKYKYTRKLSRQWSFCYGSPRPPYWCPLNSLLSQVIFGDDIVAEIKNS